MTTLVAIGKNTVTEKNAQAQVYLAARKFIENALGGRNEEYRCTITNENEFVLTPTSFDFESLEGETLDKVYKVSGKGDKPVLDIKIKQLPTGFVKGVKLKVVSMKDRLIVTVHSEHAIEVRETDIVDVLDDGKKVKIGTLFTGDKMTQMLKRCGLVQLANNITCQLAIELEPTALQSAIIRNAEFWQEPSLAAVGDLTKIDFSKVALPHVNGLVIDATQFDINTDKKAGKQRSISSDDDYNDSGALFLSAIEVLKRSNPAFVNIEVEKPSGLPKKEQAQRETNLSTIMTVFSSVLTSLGYNIKQTVDTETGNEIVSLLAISKGLSIDEIKTSSVVASTPVTSKPIQPTLIESDRVIERNIIARNNKLISTIKNEQPLLMGSSFSGGGILDRSLHDGFADMNLNSICKFGIEWLEPYFNSNLTNNADLWSDQSYFLLGDVRTVNVYNKALSQVNGLALGIPCIGASQAGLVKNKIACAEEHEIAGALFISSIEIIKSANPAFVVLENVPGYQNTFSMEVIRSVLNNLGYDISENVYTGNEYGALENRERLIMVATSKGLADGSDILNILPPVVEKQPCLNDVLEEVPAYDDLWKHYDGLEAKLAKNLANGTKWKWQKLTGEEKYCGTIGRGYIKVRSTEPFVIFDLDGKFNNFYERLINGDNPHEIFNEIMSKPGFCHMYLNFAKNIMQKFNRRQGLKGTDKQESNFVNLLSKYTPTNQANCFTGVFNDSHNVLISDIEIKQFIEATHAISKATRLFTVNEHASVKRVPVELVDGLAKTTAHEILGNGVVFSLFKALGRRLGAWMLNIVNEDKVILLTTADLVDIGLLSSEGIPDSKIANVYKLVPNVDSFYMIDIRKSSVVSVSSLTEKQVALAA